MVNFSIKLSYLASEVFYSLCLVVLLIKKIAKTARLIKSAKQPIQLRRIFRLLFHAAKTFLGSVKDQAKNPPELRLQATRVQLCTASLKKFPGEENKGGFICSIRV